MDKYLKELLEKYAKVILPSFGAIVVENEETGNLMFNEYLSYNDGKLDDLIVSESNMELQEAQNMIAKYIRDIQVQIDKGESYDIFELGRFYKNEDGDIEFEGNLKSGLKSESKKESSKVMASEESEAKSKKEKKPEKEEPSKPKEEKKEPKQEPKKEENKKDTKVDPSDKKEQKKDSKSTEKENKFVAKKEAADVKKDTKKQEEKKVSKPSSKDKTPKPKKKKKEKTPKEGKKKKRFGAFFWIAIIILALASGGLIYVGLNYEKVKSYMGWDKFNDKENVASNEVKDGEDKSASETINSESGKDNLEKDTTNSSNIEMDEEGNMIEEEGTKKEEVKPESKVETKPDPQPKATSTVSNGTHHLIAGSFSNLSNAKDLVEQLKGKGLDARILGEFGGLHFVAAASYNSSKEAQADINRIRQKASGAWIFKYNDK